MTYDEIKIMNDNLKNQLSKVDYMKLCRLMEHTIEFWERKSDIYEFKLYESIRKEVK